jgi:phage tail-like protein
MRTGLPDLPTPHRIGERLPALFIEDEFTQRFVGGLDQVLAPLFLVLDSFPAYLDPRLAPEDFLAWLAAWVALPLDGAWPVELRRELVASAVVQHRRRGTREGLASHLRLLTGGDVEVTDSGSCGWTQQAGEPVAGAEVPSVTVRVREAAPTVDATALRAAVVEAVPAHVRVVVELHNRIGTEGSAR